MTEAKKILVIEDECELREIIVSLLKERHSEVHQASNGAEALEMIKKEEYTLILSDIKMPVMTGLEFFYEAQVDLKHTPVVFVTAYGDYENTMKALQLGAFDFVKKPFDDNELLGVVERGLEVGFRKKQILKKISELDPETQKTIETQNRMISLLQVRNFKKRAS